MVEDDAVRMIGSFGSRQPGPNRARPQFPRTIIGCFARTCLPGKFLIWLGTFSARSENDLTLRPFWRHSGARPF
jgi:hypothetical protein